MTDAESVAVAVANFTDMPTCASLDYHQLRVFYDVRSLRARRVQGDVLFLTKVFKGLISSPYLLQSFSLHILSRITRIAAFTLLDVPRGRVNAVQSGLFLRISRLVNDFITSSPSSDVGTDRLDRKGEKGHQSVHVNIGSFYLGACMYI